MRYIKFRQAVVDWLGVRSETEDAGLALEAEEQICRQTIAYRQTDSKTNRQTDKQKDTQTGNLSETKQMLKS